MSRFRLALLACVAAGSLSLPAAAGDITAEQSAFIYDLTSAVSGEVKARPGTDEKILGNAMTVLKQEGLAGLGGRPNFQETGILENYGKAMFLGSRTAEFAPDIGRIRDIVSSGDRPALEQALSDLWVKAGRAKPDSKALEPVINSLYGAKGREPEETIRHVIDKPGHRVEVMHARAGGLMQVDVTAKDKKGHEVERTVLQGLTETKPTADGNQLQRAIKLENTCTSTEKTDRDTVKELDGEWMAQGGGKKWTVARNGDEITLTETRGGSPPLIYKGSYRLGRVSAEHPITAVTDMGDELPMDVRQQLTGMNLTFRISLEFCAGDTDELRGTWSSQHVTYDGWTHSVSKVHDPYDVQLMLTRNDSSEEKVAQGAAQDELL